jgi:hypothetical protein
LSGPWSNVFDAVVFPAPFGPDSMTTIGTVYLND